MSVGEIVLVSILFSLLFLWFGFLMIYYLFFNYEVCCRDGKTLFLKNGVNHYEILGHSSTFVTINTRSGMKKINSSKVRYFWLLDYCNSCN